MSDIHILIVDDEEVIRDLLQRVLNAYTLTFAVDGIDGLEKYRVRRYDLVITDYTMPGRNGLELAEEMQKVHPHQRILLLSSNSAEVLAEARSQKVFTMLRPFSVNQLQQQVAELLTP
ncbi:MAG: response regulator [Patescibacteria group bacterium]